jgi:hypothetical protein
LPAGSGRDLRIDTVRGAALVTITYTHMGLFHSRHFWDTLGWAGFAETFVLLSGVVTGMVYGRLTLRAPARVLWSKALRRAGILYLSYLALALFIFGYVHLAHALGVVRPPWGTALLIEAPVLAAWTTPLFLYQPGYADIVPMYCLFLAAAPAAVLLAMGGHGAACLAASAALWLAVQLGLSHWLFAPISLRLGLELPAFDPLAWQLLFCAGLVLGTGRVRGRPLRLPDARAFWAAVAAVAVFLFLARRRILLDDVGAALEPFSDRQSLSALRIASFTVLALLVARVGTFRPTWLQQRWLARLGNHSLQVFVYSCGVAYLVYPLQGSPEVVQLLAAVTVLASLTLPAWLHERYQGRSGRRHGSPVTA